MQGTSQLQPVTVVWLFHYILSRSHLVIPAQGGMYGAFLNSDNSHALAGTTKHENGLFCCSRFTLGVDLLQQSPRKRVSDFFCNDAEPLDDLTLL
jgi:hypothetical protein